ncbi:MAG: nuclease-related domain-containing protein [Prosthecobacter sp.]
MIGSIFVAYALIAMWLFRRQKAKRRVVPPEEFVLLRWPGESLSKSVEALLDEVMNTLLYGTVVSLGLMLIPVVVTLAFPKTELLTLLLCSMTLLAVSAAVIVNRVIKLLDSRAKKKLGYLGERHVAEELQKVTGLGYAIFHDIPMTLNGYEQNIDHVAVGPMGLVVIETKARSKPNEETGTKAKVTFDGQRLIWPRFADDRATVMQVARCAQWMSRQVKEVCGYDVPVQQIIAIPGWEVVPGKCHNPRVVSGRRVSQTLMFFHEEKPTSLNKRQIEKITQMLDGLCRDVNE